MKICIINFPGINRERDMMQAVSLATGYKPKVIWHQETELGNYDCLIIPGGFSFGDYLRAGAIAARSPVMQAVQREAKRGVWILGVCNGFQILTEAGLLPGALMRNKHLKFICDEATIKIENNRSVFLANYRRGQIVKWPIANNDGNYLADAETLARLEGEGQICLTYCDEQGQQSEASNLSGSTAHIAGITNQSGRILGLMPHPENAIYHRLPTSAASANQAEATGTDGLGLFQAMIKASLP